MKDRKKEKNTLNTNPYSVTERNNCTVTLFEQFWKAYPAENKGSKYAAFERWEKLNGRRPDNDILISAFY